MFRKLYWVTEEVSPLGSSHVLGVFTSIPNLLKGGMPVDPDLSRFRLTLTKLDCEQGPLASWTGSMFHRLGADLVQFVATEEISEEQRLALAQAIEGYAVACKAAS
ncbi:MAG TPA: hypothetical protein VG944_19725 [Fimbriimonas sp.]|nr:hypothetical protein [Fimbriimonas sp.]